jgi:hypothetical protein
VAQKSIGPIISPMGSPIEKLFVPLNFPCNGLSKNIRTYALFQKPLFIFLWDLVLNLPLAFFSGSERYLYLLESRDIGNLSFVNNPKIFGRR